MAKAQRKMLDVEVNEYIDFDEFNGKTFDQVIEGMNALKKDFGDRDVYFYIHHYGYDGGKELELRERRLENDEEFASLAAELVADLVVLDKLDTEAELVRKLKEFSKVVTFEDLGTGAQEADLLVSDLYDNPRVPADRQLTGVENAILAPSFETLHRRAALTEKVEHVLVLFGGTDPSHLADKALRALEALKYDGRVTVIRGLGASTIDQSSYELDLEVLSNVKNIPAIMATADIALSSAGRTITELSAIGVPTICLAQNHKELTHTHT